MGSFTHPKNRDYGDKHRIDLNQSYQVAYWKERFGISQEELGKAVSAAFRLLRDWLTGGDRYLRHQCANFLGLGRHRVQHLLPISRLQPESKM